MTIKAAIVIGLQDCLSHACDCEKGCRYREISGIPLGQSLCRASQDGLHVPDPATVKVTRAGPVIFFEVTCQLCRDQGCAGVYDPKDIDW